MKMFIRSLIALLMVSVLTACGTGGANLLPSPAAPSNLVTIGSLGNIHLSWTASSGPLSGYNIYRSTDGIAFTRIASTSVAVTSYDDPIASPAGDGVFYYYKVAAAGSIESDYSNIATTIHGTRLGTTYPAGFTTATAASPYVAEGTTVVEGGNLAVAANTKLYVLGNSTVDIEQGHAFTVNGLLRVLAATTTPATFTSHVAGGGTLTGNQGFRLALVNAVDYATAGNSGTLIQNTRLTNLQSGGSAVSISGCRPKLYNLHMTASSNSVAYMDIQSGAVIQNCSITNIYPSIQGDQRSTGFQMDHNIVTTNFYDYVLEFVNSPTPPITDGQVAYNTFNGPGQIDLSFMTGGGSIPLGTNYWQQGPPTTRQQNGSVQIPVLTPLLTGPPAGVGPTW